MRKIMFIVLALALGACTRVETGEIGLYKSYSGEVSQTPLPQGMHQSIVGEVLLFSTKEVLVPLRGLKPITSDKLPMEDVDVQYTFHVNPDAIPRLYTHYNASYHRVEGRDMIPMLGMVDQFVRSATSDAIAKVPSLQVNDRRAEIVAAIEADVQQKLRNEKLETDVVVGQIVFTNVSIPASIVASTEAVIKTQNAAKAALQQVEVVQAEAKAAIAKAQGEAQAIQIQAQSIASQGGSAYLQLKAIEKWDGKLPDYLTPNAPIPFVGNATKGGGAS